MLTLHHSESGCLPCSDISCSLGFLHSRLSSSGTSQPIVPRPGGRLPSKLAGRSFPWAVLVDDSGEMIQNFCASTPGFYAVGAVFPAIGLSVRMMVGVVMPSPILAIAIPMDQQLLLSSASLAYVEK